MSRFARILTRFQGSGGLDLRGDDLRRLGVLALVCVLGALLVVQWTSTPTEALGVGDVAPRTVKASRSFQYTDLKRQEALVAEARASVPPVFVHRADLRDELADRVHAAFRSAREHVARRGDEPLAVAERAELYNALRGALAVHVADDKLAPLVDAGFPIDAETLTVELLDHVMRGYVVTSREDLPTDQPSLRVIELRGDARAEYPLENTTGVLTPADARQAITVATLDRIARQRDSGHADAGAAWVESAAELARALVRPNLQHDELETRDRRDRAAASVPAQALTVKRGTTLFRKGDVLTEGDVVRYRALQATAGTRNGWVQPIAVALFLTLLLTSLYHFGATYVQGFSTRVRDVAAVGALLVLVTALARVVVASAEGVAGLIGLEAEASSVWFVVPVAGAAMLVRLLVGVAWTTVFSVAAAAMCGLMMDLQALHVVFFVLSAIAAAGAVEHTRERLAVLRAGVYTGIVNAATVLVIHFLQLFIGDGEVSLATTMRPVWSMAFAFVGGCLSAFLVLGFIPLFEMAGFVTDYRLMELANLNHPLLRQLMLRAPGSYHHSVLVGTLAEAACEAIGANALQARVAAYFHDIGKTVKPQYFVENQRGTVNRHASLDPHASARVIINHVIDGGRMAREHKLPQPIVDNIFMHHGTGLLQYFYEKARSQALDPDSVDEASFRYPGPKPNTREAGIIMLADKVEAATRTIREPTEDSIRSMIHAIINSVMADNQFEKCPLTFQEIHTIADTFVQVLMGIYHQRVEYPATRAISRAGTLGDGEAATPPAAPDPEAPTVARSPNVITLEMPSPFRKPAPPARAAVGHDTSSDDLDEDTSDPDTDWESVPNLPRGGSK